MILKHDHLDIPAENPFENCKLDRKKYADVLTQIVETNVDGFVLAINNSWGTGKSTFVKMWKQDLINHGFQTVYFNAWENDFDNNPFLAITSELNENFKDEEEEKFKGVLKKAAKISKHILPAVIEHYTKKHLGVDSIDDLAKTLTEGSLEVIEDEIKVYNAKKEGIIGFKQKLEEFIEGNCDGKPLIFMVDELDRCRPSYAVEILENIKHFFSVKGIVFVISIDKDQLGHAVRGYYGNDRIDSEEYLRRFIDIEYTIPSPDMENYCKHLFDVFDFSSFFSSQVRIGNERLKFDGREFIAISKVLFKDKIFTLRQIEKIYAHARLALRLFKENQYVLPDLFLFLIYLKQHDISTYNSIRNKNYSAQELLDYFESKILVNQNYKTKRPLLALLASLLFAYESFVEEINYVLVETVNGNQVSLALNSGMREDDKNALAGMLVGWENHYDLYNLEIGFFLEKIDLVEPFKS